MACDELDESDDRPEERIADDEAEGCVEEDEEGGEGICKSSAFSFEMTTVWPLTPVSVTSLSQSGSVPSPALLPFVGKLDTLLERTP